MTQADTEFTIIEQLLEAIFLDQEDLDQLKHEIKEVSKGTLDPLQLKKTIWSSRIRFKQEIIHDFLPYYKELMKQSSFAQSHSSELQRKIKEREDLLEIIAIRLNTLYHKVKEKNESGYINDLQEVSQLSKYDSHIKKVNEKELLVVDLTNILNLDKDQNGTLKIENIISIYNTIVELGYEPHMIADASMKHYLDSDEQYDNLKENSIINQSPAGTKADEWVLEVAKRENCKFLTNDLYRDYGKEFGNEWIFNNRITCLFSKGKFIIRDSSNNKE